MEALIENSPSAIVTMDADSGVVVRVNGQTEKLFGYRRDQMIGQPLEFLMPERYRQAHVALRQRFCEAPEVRPKGGAGKELFILRADGTEIPADIVLSPLHTETGVLVMASIHDGAHAARVRVAADESECVQLPNDFARPTWWKR